MQLGNSSTAGGTKQKRILLAEDDPAISRLLVETLGGEYEVLWARDGREALTLARHTPPDLLLLDVMMPGMDGLRASRLIRGVEGLNRVPIIFLTANDEPHDIISGIQHGARHYITKPFRLAHLCQKIKNALKDA